MSTRKIEAYGGVSFPTAMLETTAKQLNSNGIPFHVDHNLAKPIQMRGFEAFVARREDGIDELRFRAEIHEDDQHWLETHVGLSFTIMTPLARDTKAPSSDRAGLRVSADHAWFDDEALIEVEKRLIAQGLDHELVQVERAYQFSFVPDPQIFVDIVFPFLQSIGPNAVWDGIKMLFNRRKLPRGISPSAEASETTINVTVKEGDRSLTAVIKTKEEAVAQRAFDSFDHAVTSFFQNPPTPTQDGDSKSVTVWDDENRHWTLPD